MHAAARYCWRQFEEARDEWRDVDFSDPEVQEWIMERFDRRLFG